MTQQQSGARKARRNPIVGLYNFRTHRSCVRRRIGGCGVKLQRLKGEVDNPIPLVIPAMSQCEHTVYRVALVPSASLQNLLLTNLNSIWSNLLPSGDFQASRGDADQPRSRNDRSPPSHPATSQGHTRAATRTARPRQRPRAINTSARTHRTASAGPRRCARLRSDHPRLRRRSVSNHPATS